MRWSQIWTFMALSTPMLLYVTRPLPSASATRPTSSDKYDIQIMGPLTARVDRSPPFSVDLVVLLVLSLGRGGGLAMEAYLVAAAGFLSNFRAVGCLFLVLAFFN
ncbi:hypothetical protein DVH24_006023 [Malus domestica]|uniref:Uncharacterized protein n=1 Tax=Malus domestica TaxID=3750 RepID=A0A498IKQ8_MALDO|nr:hypothetical protein DVH24_006023 [Malus domestica]